MCQPTVHGPRCGFPPEGLVLKTPEAVGGTMAAVLTSNPCIGQRVGRPPEKHGILGAWLGCSRLLRCCDCTACACTRTWTHARKRPTPTPRALPTEGSAALRQEASDTLYSTPWAELCAQGTLAPHRGPRSRRKTLKARCREA